MRFRRLILAIRHAAAMYRALSLPKNRCKGHWGGISSRELLELAKREYEELFVACWELEHGKGTAERVAEEAADLSNFAAMIADNVRRRA
jgi:hypothetical protein